MASNDEQRSATTILTTAAQSIAARLIANETTAKFTKAEISTTNLFNQSVTELQVLTSLDNVQQTADINTVTVINNNTVNVNVAIDQTKAPNNYQMNSVGLFAVDGDGKEVLYSVTVLKDPVYIHQDAMGSALGIDLETVVGQASNVEISVNPAGAVTNEILKAALADYVKADDSTVVHTADMRKPASDVAGIEEVNVKADDSKVVHDNHDGSVQVNGVNIIPLNGIQDASQPYGLDLDKYKDTGNYRFDNVNTIHYPATFEPQYIQLVVFGNHGIDSNANPGSGIQLAIQNNRVAFRNMYTPGSWSTWKIAADDSTVLHNNALNQILTDNSGIIIGNDKDFGFIKRENYKGGLAIGANNNFHFMATNDAALSNTSEYHDVWSIGSDGKVSILGGASFTPADDSKVAHLSGANNFDTVPTVNNNPLLLASSLPSDLARLSQDANFTAKLQQNGQDVALANNTIARNPNTGVVSEPVDFTKLTVNGGKSVATSDDLKSLETSAWRVLDNKCITAFTKYNTSIKVDENSLFLVKIDEVNKRVYMFFTILGNFVENSSIYIDLTSIVKNLSFPSYHLYYLEGNTASSTADGSIVGNRICFKIQIYDTTVLNSKYSSYMVNANDAGWIYSSCFVNYDELV
ncbi:hypothetical protein [Levilactobacillus brevis]|uniref:hypothetical protein n=1 Tax=Levilactobacillus brevis TaxID=1580 RepID=UPI003EC0C428